MAKPLILAIDDEPAVLSAVQRDLRRQYGKDYRVVGANSGSIGIETLHKVKLANSSVALFLVDQRMPQMSGIEFLEEAMQLFPDAKRVLLTAYADTEAAIRAINEVKLDYYLLKPWDPPEERLYPALDDLLGDWQASFRPPFVGIRVVGHQWSPLSHNVKDFLARNLVPYQWLDVEKSEEAAQLMASLNLLAAQLPFVVFPDGSHLVQPTNLQIAEKIGLRIRANMPLYDLVIVGAGPAGLAAAVYGASEGLHTLLIEREAPGGQAGQSSRIENYLGFPTGLSGSDLARRARDQAIRFGAEILTPQEVTDVQVTDGNRVVILGDGTAINARSLLIATGVSYRKLNAPGIEALTGAGVYYGAAITEATSSRGQPVFVVGGGNSAGQGAMYLSQFASSVDVLVRGPSLAATMSRYLIDQIARTANIAIRPHTVVTEAHGESALTAITIMDVTTGEAQTLPASGLFIFIGAEPPTDWVAGVVARDEKGFILSGPDLMRQGRRPAGWPLDRDPFFLETSVPGIFVAGDVRYRSIKRVASAVGEGAMAVSFIHEYLSTS